MAAVGGSRSVALLALTAAAVLGAAGLAWLGYLAAPADGLDFRVYLLGGQSVIDARGELYTRSIPNGENPPLMFTYPPFAALLFALLAPFGDSLGFLLFRILSYLLTFLAAVWLTGWFAGRRSALQVLAHPWLRPAAVFGFGLLAALGPWRETIAFGQINILLFLLILGDNLSPRPGRPTGLLTGIAAGIKLTPLVFGLYYLLRGDWRGLRNMAVGFLATFALGFLVLPRESRTYWGELLPETERIGGPGYVDNLSLRGAIAHIAGPDFPGTGVWLVLAAAALAAVAVLIRRADLAGRPMTALSATALLMLLVSPVSWSHHWVWVALLGAVLLRDLADLPAGHRRLRGTGAALLAAGAVIFYLSPKKTALLLGAQDLDAQEPQLWLIAASLGVFWGVAVLAWLLCAYQRRRRWNRRAVYLPAAAVEGPQPGVRESRS